MKIYYILKNIECTIEVSNQRVANVIATLLLAGCKNVTTTAPTIK